MVLEAPAQITQAGLDSLTAELEQLQTIRRPELAKRIQRAKLFLTPPASDNIADVATRDLELADQELDRASEVRRQLCFPVCSSVGRDADAELADAELDREVV